MGDLAQRRFRRRLRALCRLHRDQSKLAKPCQEQPANAQVQAYFSQYPPLSAKGRFALARVMLASGNRKDAEALVREAWRYDSFSQEVENRVVEAFGNVLTSADHKARMDRRLYEKDDTEAGVRAAARLGGNEPLIAKARIEMLAAQTSSARQWP
jgi:soluble lytic murein transglycosylase